METIATIIAIVATACGATWALRSKLSDIERALTGHIADNAAAHKEYDAQIIQLKRNKRR